MVAANYIAEFEPISEELQVLKAEEQLQVERLISKKSKTKTAETNLKQANAHIALIDFELGNLERLRQAWLESMREKEQRISMYNAIQQGACGNIETDAGIYPLGQIDLSIEEYYDEMKYFESIPIISVQKKSAWVKKKQDANCLSANPDDCLVWCLVESIESFTFLDDQGMEYTKNTCPTGFTYDAPASECVRERTIEIAATPQKIVNIKRKSDGRLLNLIKWEALPCD